MVNFNRSEVIPIAEFSYAWRITDSKWAALPEETLKRIKPLSLPRSKQLLEMSAFFGELYKPFDPNVYHAVSHVSLEENEPADSERMKSWFRGLPIAPGEEVYLCWQAGEGVVVITNWHTFTENWSDLWYPFDSMSVFDESLDWAVLLGPEEHAIFVQAGPVRPGLPRTDPAYGLALFQNVRPEKKP